MASLHVSTIDAEWDEDRGGDRTPENFISFPEMGSFCQRTKKALPWERSKHESRRMIVPSVWLEGLFREANVEAPHTLNTTTDRFLCRGLGLKEFLTAALQLLIDEGLLEEEDEHGDTLLIDCVDADDLQRRADAKVIELRDQAALTVTGDSFDWLNGFDGRPQDAPISWFHGLTLANLCEHTGTLRSYCDLAHLVGPRATAEGRIDPGSIFFQMVAGPAGGQLGTSLKNYFYPATLGVVDVAPPFLVGRIEQFLRESAWPKVYRRQFNTTLEFAYDLPARARWPRAGRQEWVAMIRSKIAHALVDHLPVHNQLFEDFSDDLPKLVREVEALGDDVLPDAGGVKLPFWRIEETEAYVSANFQDFITAEKEGGTTAEHLLAKLRERVRMSRTKETGKADASATPLTDDLRAPKPAQLAKATAAKAYSGLEIKHAVALQKRGVTTEEKLDAIRDGFTADTVLPKAVLLATKGARLTAYLGQEGTDFLSLLHELRHLLTRYFGQTLAFDADLKSVPEELKRFVLDQSQVDLLCNLEWEKMDVLNFAILVLLGQEVGTKFKKHDVKELYHDADMIRNVTDVFDKLFQGIGYPDKVAPAEGVTYREFMAKIARLQKYALALTGDEQAGAYKMIDGLVRRAMVAAAAHAKRVIYGVSPADRALRAWLEPDEPLLEELDNTLAELLKTSTYRRNMGGIFGETPTAPSLRGFSTSDGDGRKRRADDDDEGGGPSRRKRKKERQKSPAQGRDAGGGGGGGSGGAGGGNSGAFKDKAKGTNGGVTIYHYEDGSFSIGELPPPFPPCTPWHTPQGDLSERAKPSPKRLGLGLKTSSP